MYNHRSFNCRNNIESKLKGVDICLTSSFIVNTGRVILTLTPVDQNTENDAITNLGRDSVGQLQFSHILIHAMGIKSFLTEDVWQLAPT